MHAAHRPAPPNPIPVAPVRWGVHEVTHAQPRPLKVSLAGEATGAEAPLKKPNGLDKGGTVHLLLDN